MTTSSVLTREADIISVVVSIIEEWIRYLEVIIA